jgi:predicted transcriptional regulator
VERVRELIEENRNHFPAVETAAEQLRDELEVPSHDLFRALSERLRERHGILVRVRTVDVMRDWLRRYSPHRKQLSLSELLDDTGRVFQTAFQLALAEGGPLIDGIAAKSGKLDDPARRLFRISSPPFRGRRHHALRTLS